MTGPSCDPEICDGRWHRCSACEGTGKLVDFDDDRLADCSICHGDGGWPCPNPEPEME
jgi:hypothetical protein